MQSFLVRLSTLLLTFFIGTTLSLVLPVWKNLLIPKIEIKKDGFLTPFDCALLVAKGMGRSGSYTLAETAGRHAEVGQFDRAIELIDTVEDVEEKAVGLAKIAVKYWRVGLRDKALETFGRIDNLRVENFSQYTLGQIAEEYAAAEQYEHVLNIASFRMEDDYHAAVALYAIAESCPVATDGGGRSNLIDRVIRSADKLKTPDQRFRVLRKIADRYAEAGQYDHALRLAVKLGGDGDEIDSYQRDEVFCKVAVELAEEGQYDRAVRLVKRTDDYYGEGALIEIAGKQIDAGRNDLALKLLSQALQGAGKSAYSADRLSEIAFQYARVGLKNKAAELFTKAIDYAVSINHRMDKAETLYKMAAVGVDAGLYDHAVKAAQGIEYYDTHTLRALAAIGVRLVRAGHHGRAMQIVEAIRNTPSKGYEASKGNGLIEVAGEYLKVEQRDSAMAVLRLAFEIASKAPPNEFKPMVLESLAERYAEAGEYAEAFAVVLATDSPFYQAHALMDIGVFHTRGGGELDEGSRNLLKQIAAASTSVSDGYIDNTEKNIWRPTR